MTREDVINNIIIKNKSRTNQFVLFFLYPLCTHNGVTKDKQRQKEKA